MPEGKLSITVWMMVCTSCRDHFTIVAENVLRRPAADNLAHGAFGDLAKGVFRICQIEQERCRIGNRIEQLELDVDDVLVARQHQAVARTGAGRPAGAHFALDDGRQLDCFERPEDHVQTRLRNLVLGLAEAQLDAAFIRLDRVDRLGQPEADQTEDTTRAINLAAAGTRTAAARKRLAQLVLAAADQFLKIGRIAATAWWLGTLAPWSLIVSTSIAAATPRAAAASILITPGHQDLFPNGVMALPETWPRRCTLLTL
jgi:hypothetical protein